MKTLDDFEALLRLVPYNPNDEEGHYVTPVGWVSYCRSIGLIDEEEWKNACAFVRGYLFLFK
jgi:hypothetical protein